MINLTYSFIAFLFGFLLSPQYVFNYSNLSDLRHASFVALLMSISVAAVSQINGFGLRMMMRSRTDYYTNIFVSAIIGISIVVLCLYLYDRVIIGRWVLVISIAFYVLLAGIHNELSIKFGVGKITLYASESSDVVFIANDLIKKRVIDGVEIKKISIQNLIKQSEKIILNQGKTFMVADGELSGSIGKFSLNMQRKLLSLVVAFENVVESEFGIILLSSVQSKKWWNLVGHYNKSSYERLKRLIDLFLVVCLGLISFPVLIVSAFIIKISDGGPVFYKQIRLGQYGIPFTIFKLRTMGQDSELEGAKWATLGDPRVTKIGRILRKTRIDEIPQIFNILRGEMSLIGPRPERPEFYALIQQQIPEFSLRLAVTPGLTGWAQVNYPYGASIEDSRLKLMYDLYYIKNIGLLIDFRILTRTIVAMVKGAR